jgi:hypothetical protein
MFVPRGRGFVGEEKEMSYIIDVTAKNSAIPSGKLQGIQGCAEVKRGVLPYGGENGPGHSGGSLQNVFLAVRTVGR